MSLYRLLFSIEERWRRYEQYRYLYPYPICISCADHSNWDRDLCTECSRELELERGKVFDKIRRKK